MTTNNPAIVEGIAPPSGPVDPLRRPVARLQRSLWVVLALILIVSSAALFQPGVAGTYVSSFVAKALSLGLLVATVWCVQDRLLAPIYWARGKLQLGAVLWFVCIATSVAATVGLFLFASFAVGESTAPYGPGSNNGWTYYTPNSVYRSARWWEMQQSHTGARYLLAVVLPVLLSGLTVLWMMQATCIAVFLRRLGRGTAGLGWLLFGAALSLGTLAALQSRTELSPFPAALLVAGVALLSALFALHRIKRELPREAKGDGVGAATLPHPKSCIQCGYNLVATPGDSRCPECGVPAALSLGSRFNLSDCPPGWVRLLVGGIVLIPTSLLLLIGAIVLHARVWENLDYRWTNVPLPGVMVFAMSLTWLTPLVTMNAGIWFLTAREPGRSRLPIARALRLYAGVVTVSFVALLIVTQTVPIFPTVRSFSDRPLLHWILEQFVLAAAIPTLLLAYLITLARRLGAAKLMEWSYIVAVGLPLCALPVHFATLGGEYGDFIFRSWPMPLLGLIAALIVLLVGWYVLNVGLFAFHFIRAAKQAKRVWTRTTSGANEQACALRD